MNWGRTKTILIVLFIIVNILLLTTYLLLNYNAGRIDEEVIDSTVSALSQHGISVNRDIIREKKYVDYHLKMASIISDKENLLNLLLGDSYKKESETEFRSEAAFVKMNGSQLHYQCERSTESIGYETVSHRTDKLSQTYLKELGFDKKTYFMYNKQLENGILTFEIMPRFKAYKIEGVRLKVKADNIGILEMEGNWFYTDTADTSSNENFCNVTSVLLNFMYITNSSGKTISRIDACLYIPSEYMSAKTVTPIPVYIILCADGSIAIFNALDASLILQNP